MAWVTLTTDGEMTFRQGVPTLTELQAAVGGYVEAIGFMLAGTEATLWCNEEGKLVDRPRNFKAEFLCALPNDWIAGDVGFTGGPDAQGATQGLTQAQVHELHRIDQNVRVILLDARSTNGGVIG